MNHFEWRWQPSSTLKAVFWDSAPPRAGERGSKPQCCAHSFSNTADTVQASSSFLQSSLESSKTEAIRREGWGNGNASAFYTQGSQTPPTRNPPLRYLASSPGSWIPVASPPQHFSPTSQHKLSLGPAVPPHVDYSSSWPQHSYYFPRNTTAQQGVMLQAPTQHCSAV